MPTPIARLRRALLPAAAATATVLALTAATTPAPVYKGVGWKAWTSNGIEALSPQPYTIVFADATARSKLAGYFKSPAAQVTTSVGVKLTVSSTLDTTKRGTCPAYHRIVVHYTYRPVGLKSVSHTDACHGTTTRSAWGGHILMDSEYWTHTAWFSSNATVNDAYRKDVVTHELGHALGLDHPNLDLNHDGKVANYECVKSATTGRKPIMCSPGRDRLATVDGGKFTSEYDLPGLRQMVKNYSILNGS
jgi:hypothetical protein